VEFASRSTNCGDYRPLCRLPLSSARWRRGLKVTAFTIAAGLMIAPAVAGTPIDLSVDPPKAKTDPGPSLSLGRVGLDPCPGGLCRTEPHTNSFYFITPKGARPIAVPGIRLSIPLDNAAH